MELLVKVVNLLPSSIREMSKVLTDLLDNFETVNDYSLYLKIDVTNEINNVQEVIDNMLTRIEELSSVLQIVKLKNADCKTIACDELKKYRLELINLCKKITTLELVIRKMNNNLILLEKHVEKAELDFGISNESKIKMFLSPFLRKQKNPHTADNMTITTPQKIKLSSVSEHFNPET